MKQIGHAITSINLRKYNEMVAQVRMHGGKMDFKKRSQATTEQTSKITPEQESIIDDAIKRRFGEKKHGDK